MDYLTSSTKALYRKYLIASLGSALVITFQDVWKLFQ